MEVKNTLGYQIISPTVISEICFQFPTNIEDFTVANEFPLRFFQSNESYPVFSSSDIFLAYKKKCESIYFPDILVIIFQKIAQLPLLCSPPPIIWYSSMFPLQVFSTLECSVDHDAQWLCHL